MKTVEFLLEDFPSLVEAYMSGNPAQRRGQALFNVLQDVRPELAEHLRGHRMDPFYAVDDTREGQLKVYDAYMYIGHIWNKDVK